MQERVLHAAYVGNDSEKRRRAVARSERRPPQLGNFDWTRLVRKSKSLEGRCYVKKGPWRRTSQTAMAASPQSIYMNSADLIKKEPLDYGGCGKVFLCYHKTHGQVVLKTVYTGPAWNEGNKRSLMEEGSLMSKLDHERIVKLLGVILENGAYSLVMELIPKGNLLSLLQEAPVPLSIKGRIILEILEGMVYLTEHKIIHKDLKPENILVDKDFHIKIADLGLSTYQTWSRLTKDESRRQSRRGGQSNNRVAGTLFYMAPEHLESIHTRSTEKSDIYSFAIVVWVVLTNQEPYENARNEDHVCQCVRNGDRPDERAIPPETPPMIIELMKKCWDHDPEQRPAFAESYRSFLPFYRENFEKDVDHDSTELMAKYEGPGHYLETMRSLSQDRTYADSPAPLRSSDSMPIEASIEDLVLSEESLQTDAGPIPDGSLKHKLAPELFYHQHGTPKRGASHTKCPPSSPFTRKTRPAWGRRTTFGPFDSYSMLSSSSSKVTPVSPPYGVGIPLIGPFSMNHSLPFRRLHSSPANPTPESGAPDLAAGKHHNTASSTRSLDQGHLFIHNASGVQIGNNNSLNLWSHDSGSGSYPSSTQNSKSLYKDLLLQFGDLALCFTAPQRDRPVREEHLDLLRENIGVQWKSCARQLGLTETEVETIDHDYSRDGLKEKVYQTLEKWRMKEGLVGCTMGRLCRALAGSIKVDLLCQLLQLCCNLTSP
ncbi:hypothetical protein SKAU_G00382080 [Synaphobranchus kaupii]|uniref:Receptor-interacting serine/threonine-protein kinase 1 n=1 Tax=Synaphobranchus kaupii TaxID=118154 RepID=A0A9Q1ICR0_SYNKA|nr:hypothetical protein SKAU_G00382080 [Synaphobranchus kaupii]